MYQWMSNYNILFTIMTYLWKKLQLCQDKCMLNLKYGFVLEVTMIHRIHQFQIIEVK